MFFPSKTWRVIALTLVSLNVSCLLNSNRANAQTEMAAASSLKRALLYSASTISGEKTFSQVFEVRRMSDGSSKSTKLTTGSGIDWLNPKLSPDNSTVLVTMFDRGQDMKQVVTFPISAVPISSPSQVTVIAGSKAAPCEDPDWSPDGKRIVYKETTRQQKNGATYEGKIVEAANLPVTTQGRFTNTITAKAIFLNHESSIPSYSLNDGGKRIVFQCMVADKSNEGQHEQIFVVDRETKDWAKVTKGETKHWFAAWNPLKNQIVYVQNDLHSGAQLHSVDLETLKDSPIAVPHQGGITEITELVDPSFSPTGRLAFSAFWTPSTNTYKLFDLDPTFTTLSGLITKETPGLFGVDFYYASTP